MDSTTTRQHQRFRFVRRIKLLLDDNRLWEAATFDISAGGTSIVGQHRIAPGTKCQLGFVLWDTQPPCTFTADAVVRHIVFAADGGYRVGLQFTDMPSSSRQILTRLLARLANPDNQFLGHEQVAV